MKKSILNTIQAVFDKYSIPIEVTIDDIEFLDVPKNSISITNETFRNETTYHDKLHKYLHNKSTSRIGDGSIMYHSLRPEYAISTLKNQEIQLSALSYLLENDPLEFTEFDRRTRMSLNYSQEKLKSIRDRIFIFCFSDTCRNSKIWEEYGKNDSGVSLGFRFTNHTQDTELKNLYHLRDVIYDDGYDFDFIIELKEKLKNKFDLNLSYEGVLHYGKFYKRGKYSWEQEIRLCFDYRINDDAKEFWNKIGLPFMNRPETDLRKHFEINYDKNTNRHFIKVPFQNSFFNISLGEIICGSNIEKRLYEQLIEISKDLDVPIWKRNN